MASIEDYRKAVEVCRRVLQLEMDSYLKARAHSRLGDAYMGLSLYQDLEENLWSAVDAYRQALESLSSTNMPDLYGRVQNSLGLALMAYSSLSDPEDHLSEAVEAFQEALKVRRRKGAPALYAESQVNLGEAYSLLASLTADREGREKRLKGAVTAYKEALEIDALKAEERARLHSRLGVAYRCLAEVEDKAANCRKAVEACLQSMEIHHPEVFPSEYADDKICLGNAYLTLSEVEDTRMNLERAVSAYDEAFKVPGLNRDRYAAIQNNLGMARIALAKGGGIEACKSAVSTCIEAVKAGRQGSHQHSAALNNLGNAYLALAELDISSEALEDALAQMGDLTLGPEEATVFLSRENILNKAVDAYKEALESAPDFRHAAIKSNMGEAFLALAQVVEDDRKLKCCKAAVSALREGLHEYEEGDPLEYARVQAKLGQAHMIMAGLENAGENCLRTAAACLSAMEVFTLEEHPRDFASTLTDLALAYSTLAEETDGLEREEYSRQAAFACDEALKVYKAEEDPEEYAAVKNVLWAAYARLAEADPDDVEIRERAVQACRAVLKIYSLEAYPEEYADAERNLGYSLLALAEVLQAEHALETTWEAVQAYQRAVEACESLGSALDRAHVLADLGYAYAALGDLEDSKAYRSAIKAYKKALKIYSGQRDDQERTARTEGCLKAIASCRKALKRAKRAGKDG